MADVSAGLPVYSVRIVFTEPTYAATQGTPERDYDWTYEVTASSPEQAERVALAEFKAIEHLSSVGWVRQIRRVEVSRTA